MMGFALAVTLRHLLKFFQLHFIHADMERIEKYIALLEEDIFPTDFIAAECSRMRDEYARAYMRSHFTVFIPEAWRRARI